MISAILINLCKQTNHLKFSDANSNIFSSTGPIKNSNHPPSHKHKNAKNIFLIYVKSIKTSKFSSSKYIIPLVPPQPLILQPLKTLSRTTLLPFQTRTK